MAGSSLHRDGYTGRAAFVVDEDRRVLVGVTFAGPDVAELLHSATVAVVGEVPLDRLWHAVPSYPTICRGVAAVPRGVRAVSRPWTGADPLSPLRRAP